MLELGPQGLGIVHYIRRRERGDECGWRGAEVNCACACPSNLAAVCRLDCGILAEISEGSESVDVSAVLKCNGLFEGVATGIPCPFAASHRLGVGVCKLFYQQMPRIGSRGRTTSEGHN